MRYFVIAALFTTAALQGCSGCNAGGYGWSAQGQPPPPPPTTPPPPPPPPEPVEVKGAPIEGTRIHIPHELEFAVDKATFDDKKPNNKEILDTLMEFMTKNTHVTKLRIEGHTDNSGKPDHNQTLSEARAAAVGKWLTDHGIDAGRIHTIGYGDTKPEVPNDSAAHKQQNRRTEFHIEEIDGKPHVPHHHHDQGGGAGAAPMGSGAAPAASGSAAPPPHH
jgi:outer membrane protein OmpA-like peptidoglycan-associated protein